MNQEHYNELLKGLASWKAYMDAQREKEVFWRADLQDADLQDANLQGADLRRADLRRADLQGANLQGADLRRAGLRDADLRRAGLRDADLQGANLQGADLRRAGLRDADLRRAKFSGVPERPADLLQQVAVAAHKPNALGMGDWHTCETCHCIAGWAIALTPGGVEFEADTSPYLAGALLVPELAPYFFETTQDALEVLKEYLP